MKRWQNHVNSAIADLTESCFVALDGDVDQALAHLHDAAANVNRAIAELECEERGVDQDDD